jgi:hypothetical protein
MVQLYSHHAFGKRRMAVGYESTVSTVVSVFPETAKRNAAVNLPHNQRTAAALLVVG